MSLAPAACDKPAPPPQATCRPPVLLVSRPAAKPDDIAHDAAFNCVKTAAYDGVMRGGPVGAAASAAVGACADKEAAYIKALYPHEEPWDYMTARVHDQLVQLAQVTAAQKRARGCGRPGGEPQSLSETQ
jgi:hypothetical protein